MRARTTLAAMGVTAVAVGLAGWLLIRSVEDTQLALVQEEIATELDEVSGRLEEGVSPEEALSNSPNSPVMMVVDADGRVVAAGPTFVQEGQTVALTVDEEGDRLVYGTLVGGDPAGAAPDGTPVPLGPSTEDAPAEGAPPGSTVTGGTSPGPGRAGEVPPGGVPSEAPPACTASGQAGSGRADASGEGPEDASSPASSPSPSSSGPGAEPPGTDLDVMCPPEGEVAPADEDDPHLSGTFVIDGVNYNGPLETLERTVETPDSELTVRAAAPVRQVDRGIEALKSALVVGLPVLVLLVGAVAWVLVGRALRPVEAIRAEVAAIGGATVHRRVPEPPTGDEIGRLARTMNAMLGRLDRAATRQRQFVSDASHELRSPVATIRTRLEVARSNPGRADWVAVADAALAEEARLEALLDDLLLLAAHDETGTTGPGAEPVDMAALVADEADRPRRVPVRVAAPGGGGQAVRGVPGQLAQVLANLLDNACRHAVTAVEVGVARRGDDVRVTVDDDGPGIPPTDRERVFERFTRLDAARARGEGGSGLGLAVVRSVVTAHGGRVRAAQAPGGGARFVVELPAADLPGPRARP